MKLCIAAGLFLAVTTSYAAAQSSGGSGGASGPGAPAGAASGGTSDTASAKTVNPGAKKGTTGAAPGTNVPGATGVNPYTGKSVGMPLQPNDLGATAADKATAAEVNKKAQ